MKSKKKFVLSGLAMLAAITMVLLPLAGCKTEVDTGSGEVDTSSGSPQQETTYTVKHLQQNVSGDGYTEVESDRQSGTVGENTEAAAKTYEGFTVQEIVQQKIAPEGTTVVEVKYDRKPVTLKLDANGGSPADGKDTISGRYGASVEQPEEPTRSDYTFTGWNPELPATFTLDVDGKTYTAQWEANTGSIEVTFPNSTGTTAKLTYTEAGGVYTFSPDFGQEYNSYRWLVNGEEQDGSSGATFQLAVGDLSAGRYEICVEVADPGVINDARVIVEVKK